MLEQPPIWLILIAFICALGPLVFIHELGHYLVGRWFGVGAEVFSIGFGREIIGWNDRRGTRWKIGWLPLGGYVRFVGDMNPASAPAVGGEDVPEELRASSFHYKPVWQRFLIVLAGPVANFLLAILIIASFFTIFGSPQSNIVGLVAPNSAAAQAGIQPGDRILSISGRETETFNDIKNFVVLRPSQKVVLELQRGETILRASTTIQKDVITDEFGQKFERGLLGISPSDTSLERVSVVEAVPLATVATARLTRMMVEVVGQIISGQRSPKELGGPLKIAQITGQQASLGSLQFVSLIAMLSINLGFINLLPVPLLDGGHLFFYAVEAVRRRPVSLQVQEWAFRGGLAAILALVAFTTINDLDSFGLWDRLERLIG
jgi:regulator of sigma E protease